MTKDILDKETKVILDRYLGYFNELRYGIFWDDTAMSLEDTEKEFKDKYFEGWEEDDAIMEDVELVLEYIYQNVYQNEEEVE